MFLTVVLFLALAFFYGAIATNLGKTVDLCLSDLHRADRLANPKISRYESSDHRPRLTTTRAEKLKLFTGEFSYP